MIVDSSKNPKFAIDETGREPGRDYGIKAIVLSKTVKEQVASYWRHQDWDGSPDPAWSPAKCVDVYISCYRSYLADLKKREIEIQFVQYRNSRRTPSTH